MSKHTPGPWPIQSHENRGYVGPVEIDGDDDEDLANARLISAAPDMLATLKAVLKGIPDDYDDAHTLALLARVEWTINKAEEAQCSGCGTALDGSYCPKCEPPEPGPNVGYGSMDKEEKE